MYTCQGTAMVAIYAKKSAFLPGKFNFENAYPAKLEVNNWRKVTTTVRNIVFCR
jgi:hypothetical protein